ncbi:LamB/YcsF family protein [Leucobacter soli]|uniref:5-oxoprolinase subunit A n=1 Tax=Leucobacter soli TaxID=2812850 RepID=A0A916NWC1_9MICO|nr:5-oxoprolinase subunit PxpA [Leucobacter soli]CAG7615761.1 5-oxoprolinase subunit A [Leucobacter soli]
MRSIDLNSDVGEFSGQWVVGDDDAIFAHISSANVACGGHAGDPTIIRATCRAAAGQGVIVGAHPSYRDLAGFGRRFIDVPAVELADELIAQIGLLQALAHAEGTSVRYVKPHGALYNAIVSHRPHAQAVVDAIRAVDPAFPLVVPPFSEVQRRAEDAGVRTVVEAFADRAYTRDGGLVPRTEPDAVIHDSALVVERALRIVDGHVLAIDGTRIDIGAETLCLHGDTPGAVELSASIERALHEAGVETRSFVDR